MKRWPIALASLAVAIPAFAGWQSRDSNYNINAASGGGFTPSCSQSTDFLARATAVTNDTDKTNYDTLICGLETDGVGCSNTLDVLYILAAPDSATYLLNICSSSFTLTANGTGTFTANQGYAGNGSTGFLNTGYVASSGTFGNSINAHLGVYIRTNRTTNANTVAVGGNGSSGPYLYIQPRQGSNVGWSVNGNNTQFPVFANTTAQGSWSAIRASSSSQSNMYLNGSSTSFSGAISNANSGTVLGVNLYIGAQNNNGTAAQFSNDQIAAVWYGSTISAANALLLRTRINNFMTAYGTNVY